MSWYVSPKNVGPYEVWGGNPAKCIKKRFDEDTIERLLAKEWWNWDDSAIQSKACYMNDIHIFLGEDE